MLGNNFSDPTHTLANFYILWNTFAPFCILKAYQLEKRNELPKTDIGIMLLSSNWYKTTVLVLSSFSVEKIYIHLKNFLGSSLQGLPHRPEEKRRQKLMNQKHTLFPSSTNREFFVFACKLQQWSWNPTFLHLSFKISISHFLKELFYSYVPGFDI